VAKAFRNLAGSLEVRAFAVSNPHATGKTPNHNLATLISSLLASGLASR
jgi:hypothetical protein